MKCTQCSRNKVAKKGRKENVRKEVEGKVKNKVEVVVIQKVDK